MKVNGVMKDSVLHLGYYAVLKAYEGKEFEWSLETKYCRTRQLVEKIANRLAKKLGLEIEWED